MVLFNVAFLFFGKFNAFDDVTESDGVPQGYLLGPLHLVYSAKIE